MQVHKVRTIQDIGDIPKGLPSPTPPPISLLSQVMHFLERKKMFFCGFFCSLQFYLILAVEKWGRLSFFEIPLAGASRLSSNSHCCILHRTGSDVMIWIILINLEDVTAGLCWVKSFNIGFRQPVWVQAWLQSATKSGEPSWSMQIGELVDDTLICRRN